MAVTRRGPRLLALAAWLLAHVAGCRALANRDPMPESLAACRELSQQAFMRTQRNEWGEAEMLLARAIQECPTSAEARRHYAEALWHREAFDLAAEQMEAALQLDGSDAQGTVRAGEMWLALGQVDKARVRADQALDLNSRLAAAWHLHGRVMKAAGDTDGALADLHRALDLSPDDRGVLLEMAELYRVRNQPRRALCTLQHLVDVYPPGEEPGQALYLQGLAFAALGRHHDAADCLLAASRRGETTAEVFFRLAEAHVMVGRPAAAHQAVREALACDGQHEPSLLLLGRLDNARQTTAESQLR